MGVKRNMFANYVGQIWRGIVGVIFVPIYIRYLGVESYGLVAIFAILQAGLTLLDVGMRPALSREMARFSAGQHTAQEIRDLLRSVELIAATLAGFMMLIIWSVSGWLATHWIHSTSTSPETVSRALSIMAIIIGLRFVESIYASSLGGLQRQITDNVISTIAATVRALGAIAVLVWLSPTIRAFFIWQSIVSLVTVFIYGRAVYASIPHPGHSPSFSVKAVLSIWKFAAGMTMISGLAFLLVQTDKILLSRLLPLSGFAYYALAAALANSLYLLIAPITNAYYPKFTELVACRDMALLKAVYHEASQLVTVVMGGMALVLIVFSGRILYLWTGNPTLTSNASPLLAVLALGTLLNGLISVPYQMQLAFGWTSLAVTVNAIAVGAMVPLLLWLVPLHGAIAAAWTWVALNAGYLVVEIYFMHRRILPTEKRQWYVTDILTPLAASAITVTCCRWLLPESPGRLIGIAALAAVSLAVVAAGACSAPAVRQSIVRLLIAWRRTLRAQCAARASR